MTLTAENTFTTAKSPSRRMKKPVPNIENALPTQPPEIASISDSARIRLVAHQLLDHLEVTIKQQKPRSEEARIAREERMKLLFGEENSCAENLVMLSNLLLKLEPPMAAENRIHPAYSEELRMTPADLALVDNFVSRMRGRE